MFILQVVVSSTGIFEYQQGHRGKEEEKKKCWAEYMLSEVMLKQKGDADLNVECIEYEAKSFFFSYSKNISQITNLTTKKCLKDCYLSISQRHGDQNDTVIKDSVNESLT